MTQPECLAIGLDVGGTKVAGGIVEFPSGRILMRRLLKTMPEREGETVLRDVVGLAQELMEAATALDRVVLGIGMGVAELVDSKGNVTSGHTLRWSGLPVQEKLSRLAPAIVESDVRAAALAEALFGAGRNREYFIYLTVGTGISSCLVLDGRPYAGAHGNALVLASSPLTTTCTHCSALLKPVLEEFASGPALVRRFNEGNTSRAACGEDVLASASAGDPAAVQVVTTAGEALGVSAAFLINTLDPDALVVGGGLGLADGLYWHSFVQSTRIHIWSETHRDLPIVHAALGKDAGLVGAAASLYQRQSSPT